MGVFLLIAISFQIVCLFVPSINGVQLGILKNYMYNTKCLRVQGGPNYANGAEYELIDCNKADIIQHIRIDGFQSLATTPGYIVFDFDGKCLSNSGYSTENGAHVVQWDCVGNTNQQFQIINGDISSSFELQIQSNSKCLTAENSGTYMDQWDCLTQDYAPHQYWIVEAIDQTPTITYFMMENYNYPGMCLHAIDGSPSDSAALELTHCNVHASDQLFTISNDNYDSGYSAFVFSESGKCLDVVEAGVDNGARIDQYSCGAYSNQRWMMINRNSDGSFELQSQPSGRCLTAEGGGSYMDIWDCLAKDYAPHQFWKIKNPEGHKYENFYLIGKGSGLCLTVEDQNNNGIVDIYDCTPNAPNQLWTMGQVSNQDVTGTLFFADQSGRCLTVYGASTENNAQVNIYDCWDNASNQIWEIENVQELQGYAQIRGLGSNKCLTVLSAATSNGAMVNVYDCVQADNQLWFRYYPNQ